MRKEFLVERQGRTFCLYAGLLDEAHARGLESITTQLIQAPGPDNGHTAICYAVVTLASDQGKRSFSGLGDASPENVSRMMAPHLIRMAETRAKARALRDAVNVGVAALEELAEAEEAQGGPGTQAPPPATAGPGEPAAPVGEEELPDTLRSAPESVRKTYLTWRRRLAQTGRDDIARVWSALYAEYKGRRIPNIAMGLLEREHRARRKALGID